jgi:hypothetical protein
MREEAIEPHELLAEFRSGLRIAVRGVERDDQHAPHSGFDVTRLRIARIAGQFLAREDRLAIAGKNGDTVPGFLSAPDDAVARLLDRRPREFAVRRLELLKAGDVRLRHA